MNNIHPRAWTAAWLSLLVVLQAGAVYGVHRLFVGTTTGQRVETAALHGNEIGRERIAAQMASILDLVSAVSVLVAVVVVVFIALARRRIALAVMAAGLLIGANVTTQVLKRVVFDRPDLGVDAASRVANSMPSGHTTVAAAVVCALVLVVPPKVRGLTAVIGTGYAVLTGVATLVVGWHRPSDAVAAYLVVGAWAALAGVALTVVQRPGAAGKRGAHPIVTSALVIAALCLLAAAGYALDHTIGMFPEQWTRTTWGSIDRRDFFIAYAGGTIGIAGACAVTMALFVATINRIAPRRLRPPDRTSREEDTSDPVPTPAS